MFTKYQALKFILYIIIFNVNFDIINAANENGNENSTDIPIENVNSTIPTEMNATSTIGNTIGSTIEVQLDVSTTANILINNNNTNNWSNTTPNYLKGKDLPQCQRNNNEFSQCLREILTMGIERLKHGNPEHNIPNLDPFTFNRTVYEYNTGPIKGELFINKAQIYGLTKIQYNKIQFQKHNNHIALSIGSFIPKMHITGSYKGKMQYNNFTMRPKGTFNITINNINIEEKTNAFISSENQYKFLRFYNMTVEPNIGNMTIKASGIFDDNRLNDVVVNVINQYWREFYRVLYSTIKDYWSPIVLLITNESLKMAPFDIKN